MAEHHIGKQTLVLERQVGFLSSYAIVGPKEGQGPLGKQFDLVLEDDSWGEKSWELGESRMFEEAAKRAVMRAGKRLEDVNFLLGGDLLNQLLSASFAARNLNVPFLGLYGACSTMAESLALGSLLTDGGYSDHTLCVASSHFSSAERQFRMPLEMGSQRPPAAQRTVTGAGAVLLARNQGNPRITHVTIGRVVDYNITDSNNMGAAMAPAAVDTIATHLHDTGRKPEDYDLIVTGDLGAVGSGIAEKLLRDEGMEVQGRYVDCGNLIFEEGQHVDSGGSGCGCSASVLCCHLVPAMRQGKYKRILFLSTGALMSTTSAQQGESTPGIAHAIALEWKGES